MLLKWIKGNASKKKFSHNLNLTFKVYHYSVSLRKIVSKIYKNASMIRVHSNIRQEFSICSFIFFEGRVIKPDSSGYTPTAIWSLREIATLEEMIPRN